MADDILTQVKEIVAEQLDVPPEEIKSDANFVDDLGADSLDLTELVMAMEDKFEVEIDDEKAQSLRTVQDAVEYIKTHQAPQTA
jgi:acyl carrier protein